MLSNDATKPARARAEIPITAKRFLNRRKKMKVRFQDERKSARAMHVVSVESAHPALHADIFRSPQDGKLMEKMDDDEIPNNEIASTHTPMSHT